VACATRLDDSYFFYGNGKGGLGAAIPIADTIKNQGGFSIAAGDFNNDGAPDLAIPIELKGKVAILLNTHPGRFIRHSRSSESGIGLDCS
jgi:hypothetical protein